MCGDRYFQIFDDLLLALDTLQYCGPDNKGEWDRHNIVLISHVFFTLVTGAKFAQYAIDNLDHILKCPSAIEAKQTEQLNTT